MRTLIAIPICLASINCAIFVGPPTEAAPDAAPIERRCSADQPFNPPVHAAELSSSARETDVRLSRDERTAYITRGDISNGTTPSTLAILTATRDNKNDPFDPLVGMNFGGVDPVSDAMPSSDGLSLFMTIQRQPVAGQAIGLLGVARRNTIEGAFGAVTELGLNQVQDPLDPNGVDQHPYVLPSGAIWFSSNRDSMSLVGDLWRAEPSGLGFTAPTRFAELSTTASEVFPVVSDDELAIYFAREIGGQLDIMVATRTARDMAFSTPVPVAELNTQFGDRPSWLSPDGCRLYFTSARDGGTGLFDVWHAERVASAQ